MRTARAFCLIIVLSFCCLTVAAQTSGLSSEKTARIEAIVASEMEKHKIPGLSVAIALDNRLVYEKGFGSADLENQVAATAQTAYRTASIAKAMTAVALMQLAARGKLDLDAPVQKYCPAFPAKQWPVTTRQLLGHLGGVRHYKSGGEASGTQLFYSIAESLTLFADEPLLHEPGTKYTYTTYGYNVLGCALEGASGMSYEEYMRERVWQPAGMTRTFVDNQRLLIKQRARGYTKLDQQDWERLPEAARRIARVNEIYNASLHDTSMKIPGGGLLSTSADLVRFALAVNTGKLLDRAAIEQMWTEQKTRDGKGTRYGLGWGVGDEDGLKLVSHSGGQAGTSTFLALIPEKGLAVAVMCNLDGTPVSNIAQQIGAVLMPPAGQSR